MPKSLNATLYQILRNRFGDVRISNAGQARQTRLRPDPQHPGWFINEVTAWGEQYLVNCPFCGDTRQRLAISYRYGVVDRVANTRNYSAAYCPNEQCLKNPRNRDLLRNMLAIPVGQQIRQQVFEPQSAPELDQSSELREVAPPEGIISIGELPASHPAVQYLKQRRFDAHEIGQKWGTCYCAWSENPRPAIRDALVIPIHMPQNTSNCAPEGQGPVVAGWQARRLAPFPGEPKYLSAAGVQIKRLLYGLPFALSSGGPIILCEGVFDVWRIGYGAVALFGKTLSSQQRTLILRHFAGRPLVVLLDADAEAEAESIASELRAARTGGPGENRVGRGILPAGRDPADCSVEELGTVIEQALGIYRGGTETTRINPANLQVPQPALQTPLHQTQMPYEEEII